MTGAFSFNSLIPTGCLALFLEQIFDNNLKYIYIHRMRKKNIWQKTYEKHILVVYESSVSCYSLCSVSPSLNAK